MTSIVQKLNPSARIAFAVDKDRALRVGIITDLPTIRADAYDAQVPALRLFLPVVSLRSRVSGRLVKGGGVGVRVHLYDSMNARMRASVRLRNSRPSRSWLTSRQSLTVFRPNVDSAIL